MSYIGNKFIKYPSDVRISYKDQVVHISGKEGKSHLYLPERIGLTIDEKCQTISVNLNLDSLHKRQVRRFIPLWGTYRSLINNMIIGVSCGYSIKLELVGVGYRAHINSNLLVLKLGYSHDIHYLIPTDVYIQVPKGNILLLRGIDKQRVHQVASEIMKFRKPDPYKGKGIRILGQTIRLKDSKKR